MTQRRRNTDTYLQLLFPNFGNYGHKPSPIRINKPKTPHTLPSLAQYTSHPTTHLGVGPWVQFSTPFSTILEPTRPTGLDRPELHFSSCALLYIPTRCTRSRNWEQLWTVTLRVAFRLDFFSRRRGGITNIS